jgi:23S rRNA (uracil1939-C5)-methyltransferase
MAPLALPGELVRIQIESEKPQLIHARVAEVVERSPERVTPRCPHFGRCGGCHYQHTGYEFQVRQKVEILREVLRRMGRMEIEGDIPAVTAEPWAYRNRIQLHFADRRMGFYAAGSHDIEPIQSCDVVSPRLAEAIAKLREMKSSPRWPRFIRSLELFTNETGVQVNVLDSGTQRVNRGFFEWMAEAMPGALEPALDYPAAGQVFRVSHKSFFQVNRLLVDQLVEVALSGATGETALDLYAGVGLFSLPLSGRFSEVTAVEAGASAAADLAFNVERHGKERQIRTARVRTEDYLASLKERPGFVLADPPRAGLGKSAVTELLRIAPPRIHLVSCDPPTLARDLQALVPAGYRVEGMTMLDLFPQTSHIESVTRLVQAS